MKFCPKCGAQNKDEAKFCVDCGTEIGNITVAEPQADTADSQSTGQKNKWIAPILNFIGGMLIYGLSGIGHALYLRLYKRAAIFAAIGFLLSAIFFVLFIFADSFALTAITTLIGIAFTLYAAYDAYKCSEAMNEGRELPALIGGIRPESLSTGMAVGALAISLIVMIVAFGAFASSLIINDIATTSVTDRIISNDVTSSADNDSGLIIKITCPSEWSASFGDSEDSTTYQGTGDETIELSNTRYDVLAAAVQKTKGNSDKLKVEIIKDGKVLDSDSTTKEYGVVTVSATL